MYEITGSGYWKPCAIRWPPGKIVLVSTGNGSGIITTTNVQLVLFPHESVAMQFTGVLPDGKALPDGGLQTTVGAGSQLSLAVTV